MIQLNLLIVIEPRKAELFKKDSVKLLKKKKWMNSRFFSMRNEHLIRYFVIILEMFCIVKNNNDNLSTHQDIKSFIYGMF